MQESRTRTRVVKGSLFVHARVCKRIWEVWRGGGSTFQGLFPVRLSSVNSGFLSTTNPDLTMSRRYIWPAWLPQNDDLIRARAVPLERAPHSTEYSRTENFDP